MAGGNFRTAKIIVGPLSATLMSWTWSSSHRRCCCRRRRRHWCRCCRRHWCRCCWRRRHWCRCCCRRRHWCRCFCRHRCSFIGAVIVVVVVVVAAAAARLFITLWNVIPREKFNPPDIVLNNHPIGLVDGIFFIYSIQFLNKLGIKPRTPQVYFASHLTAIASSESYRNTEILLLENLCKDREWNTSRMQ